MKLLIPLPKPSLVAIVFVHTLSENLAAAFLQVAVASAWTTFDSIRRHLVTVTVTFLELSGLMTGTVAKAVRRIMWRRLLLLAFLV